ncbi:MAG: hypothetical protein QOK35_1921, partial [Pseudonocardiales bacterium]|nr:hypothetical protein [Pseudonocardiales bacterium]
IPWSPLGSGVLTGKYTRADLTADGDVAAPSGTRRDVAAGNGALTEHNLGIAEVVTKVAAELGVSAAQAAVAWTLRNPAVTAPILGVRTLPQLEDNLGALDVTLDDAQLAALDEASAVDLGFPHEFLARPMTRTVMFGGVALRPR